jgi:hypothetical protein
VFFLIEALKIKKHQIKAQSVEQFAAWHPIIKKFAKEELWEVEKLKNSWAEKHIKRAFNHMEMKKLPDYLVFGAGVLNIPFIRFGNLISGELAPKSIYAQFYISDMVPNTYIE